MPLGENVIISKAGDAKEREEEGGQEGPRPSQRLLNATAIRDPEPGVRGGSSPRGSPGVGSGGGMLGGADNLALFLGGAGFLGLACPGDRQPESWVTSVMRNIPKQEFCLLQNHCSLCDLVWLI